MAEFCKQCSLELYGEDTKDLANLLTAKEVKQKFNVVALCEGCGYTLVDNTGTCVAIDCEKHGEANLKLSLTLRKECPTND
ncbi:MAG: hypothetical protein DRJ63_08600 [Thermoprotei archaeon]|nr:MAG: hypothetical protein DRJ63_08600 [Thermoprotei archaeon]